MIAMMASAGGLDQSARDNRQSTSDRMYAMEVNSTSGRSGFLRLKPSTN
jgi:hypothetical protein